VSAISDLLSNYQHVIESLTVTAGSQGIFDIAVDGELIYSKDQTGRHARPGEILELFTAVVGDIRRYGEE
jgi:predicted Rdx family selenoprotein